MHNRSILVPLALLASLAVATQINAQRGDNYAKLGVTAFSLSDGQEANHSFLSLGASYEHLFSGQFSLNLNVNAARLVGDPKYLPIDGYIKNIGSAETEVRFYPGNKGKGFYAGASLVLYRDKRIIGDITQHSTHLGSHINVGVQFPLKHDFYLQTNVQLGIYGKGYSTIARYGLNVMVGKRF